MARETNAAPQEREDLQRSIAQRKGAMADTARALAGRLDRAALDARRDKANVARELEEAADTLRARRIEDKIRITQNRIGEIPPESQQANERLITADIAQLNKALDEARAAAQAGANTEGQRSAQATERARDLVRGMESLDERTRQQQEQGRQGQPGAGGQLGRELRERLNDARALRRELAQRGGVDLSQLTAIRDMERLGSGGGSMSDPRASRELRGQVLEGLRSFEYALGAAFAGKSERVLVDRAGEVPAEYRRYVEEYYRSLARTRPK